MRSLNRSSTFQFGDLRVRRLGYGAMHLSGDGIFGPPKDRGAALTVLREAVTRRMMPLRAQTHRSAPRYYGPHITNQRAAKRRWVD
jgi:hypothetical protein